MPHRETAEFVNVGVVAACPEIDFFDFKLMSRRARRVHQFFPELDRNVFEETLAAMEADFKTRRNTGTLLTEGSPEMSPTTAKAKVTEFTTLMRRRESILHFCEPRTCMTDTPSATVKQMYDRLVNRSFAKTTEYREVVMRREVDGFLKEWNLRKFYKTNRRVGTKDYHIALPFVAFGEQRRADRAIKPLDLNRKEPTDIYTHGDEWVVKFRRLKERDSLPIHMIVPVVGPEQHPSHIRAARDICGAMEDIGVFVVPFNDTNRIHELAKVSVA